MKRKALLFLSSAFFLVCVNGQCPVNIEFTTQAQIDAFPTDYPGCADIPGNVIVTGADIVNLNGLSEITSVGITLRFFMNANLTSLNGIENITAIGGNLEFYASGLENLHGLEQFDSLPGALIIDSNASLSSLTGLENLVFAEALVISNNNGITSLAPLANLTSTGLNLIISGNTLTNMEGLENLTTVGGYLNIESDSNLISLDGLENLSYVGKGFGFTYNYSLTDISALANLQYIGDGLGIVNNHSLTNLHGLENITEIPTVLTIDDNVNLTSIEGLANLTYVQHVMIHGNVQLASCYNAGICNALADPAGLFQILYNAWGCGVPELQSTCPANLSQVTGRLYADLNCNSVFDGNDVYIPHHLLTKVNNDLPFAFSDSSGNYLSFLPMFTTTEFTADPLPGFTVTPAAQTVTTNGTSQTFPGYDFAYCPDSLLHNLRVTLAEFTPPRPGFNHLYQICVENTGVFMEDATLTFDFSGAASGEYVTIIDPAGGIIDGPTVNWILEDIPLFSSQCFIVTVQMDPTTPLGTVILPHAQIEGANGIAEITLIDNTARRLQTVVGSFDPNDKAVDQTQMGYTDYLEGDSLSYLIRFQNTGTFPATFVEVLDTLPGNLDLSSFEMIAASHAYILSFPAANVLKWRFDDINLPDSTINEPGSHGFVNFSLRPVQGLSLAGSVSNAASIYFDFNAPVITNTATTAFVAQCPTDIRFYTQEEVDAFPADYPGCTEISGIDSIVGTDISNLNGLSSLTAVGGLVIVNNNSLTSLAGLDNIHFSGGDVIIYNNNALTDLTGLGSLESIGGELSIGSNDALTNLSGLENLQKTVKLTVTLNNALTSLSGLENLDSIMYHCSFTDDLLTDLTGLNDLKFVGTTFHLTGMHGLTSLTGLENLTFVGAAFSVYSCDQLTDFEGLENLDSIGGQFYVYGNENLINFTGLDNLRAVNNSFIIKENNALANFTGLESLSYVSNNVSIEDNPSLTSLSGLGHLKIVDSYFSIYNCPLTNLTGLDSLSYIGSLNIHDNPVLTSLAGLSHLDSIQENLYIHDNPQLSACSIEAICNKLADPDSVIIHSNATGCSTQEEIEAGCLPITSHVTGNVYIDLDCNEVFDGEDVSLPYHLLRKTGSGLPFAFSDQDGSYLKLLAPTATYAFDADPLPGYSVFPGTYTIATDESVQAYTGYDFRLCPDSIIHNLSVSLASFGVPQAGFTNQYQICVENTGIVPENAILTFDFSEVSSGNYVTIIDPDGGMVDDPVVTWTLANIPLFTSICFTVTVQMSSSTPMGVIILPHAQIGADAGIIEVTLSDNSVRISQDVVSSYDPNDKTVYPAAVDVTEITDGTRLDYQVRFQNTGNYPATFIEVLDTLETNLDMTTFQMVAASHPYTLSFPADNILKWRFDGIYLPDSTTNEPESHGFVNFSIKTIPGLTLTDTVRNNASIYFDFNEPVITHTATTSFFIPLPCPANISFSTQEQIDSFPLDYPVCHHIPGDVVISGPDIDNLNGLSNIDTIGGILEIKLNSSLENLTGLENLEVIGEGLSVYINTDLTSLAGIENLHSLDGFLEIHNNDLLTDIMNLENLNSIGGALTITDNDILPDLAGLENLDFIGGDFHIADNSGLVNLMGGPGDLQSIGGSFYISGNNDLINLAGLENLATIGGTASFTIPSLTDFTGLESLTAIGQQFTLIDNTSLTSLSGLENLTSLGAELKIINNNALTSLSPLENLGMLTEHLYLSYNDQLSVCDITPVCTLIAEDPDMVSINDNAPGCATIEEVEEACTVPVADISKGLGLRIFPNPTDGLTYLQYELMTTSRCKMEVSNSQGVILVSFATAHQTPGRYSLPVELSYFPSGIYQVRVIAGAAAGTVKLVVR